MNRLFKQSAKRLRIADRSFRRYLYDRLDWHQPLIIIKGARGTGKTTLLLQKMKETGSTAIYLSLDDFYFETNRLVLLVEELYERGYRHFYLDEVHQYSHWSKDLKNLYDSYSDIKVVATGSSILQIDKGQADLSRRALVYTLYGLSFREFLALEHRQKLPVYDLKKILKHHQEISRSITDKTDVLKLFKQYINWGYYPFFKNDKKNYHAKLQQVAQLVTEIDIPSVENVNYATVRGMRKLLYIISQSVPFVPNIQSLATKVGASRASVLKMMDMLEKGSVIQLLRLDNQHVSYLQKPEKIYLDNPNLAYTFGGESPNKGNLRESFFFNQLKVGHDVTFSKFGDFMVDQTYTFEVGGASKTDRQLKGVPLGYIAADDIKEGQRNKIPLWLFGLMY